MTHYFIKEGDNELGPFTFKQLKSRSITKDTIVWFAGLKEWISAGQVYELKELFVTNLSSGAYPKSKINKTWDIVLKQQFKKVTYPLILIKVKKNLY